MKSYIPECPGVTLKKTSKYGCRQPGLGNTVCAKTNNPTMTFEQHFGQAQFADQNQVDLIFGAHALIHDVYYFGDKHTSTHRDIARLLVKCL